MPVPSPLLPAFYTFATNRHEPQRHTGPTAGPPPHHGCDGVNDVTPVYTHVHPSSLELNALDPFDGTPDDATAITVDDPGNTQPATDGLGADDPDGAPVPEPLVRMNSYGRDEECGAA